MVGGTLTKMEVEGVFVIQERACEEEKCRGEVRKHSPFLKKELSPFQGAFRGRLVKLLGRLKVKTRKWLFW